MSESTVRFGLLVSMFQAMLRDRSAAKKRKRLRTFLDRVYTDRDYFSAVRLILPSLDRERGTYGLKESALANCLVDALGISKDSDDALRLINWRKGGARIGANAGNFALVAADVLQRRQGLASGGLTIKDVNDALDQLASRENRGEKTAVLSDLIKKTNAVEMKWILMIILKDLKLGISEKSIFHEFHPDAEDLFNVTCDLKLVCEKLKDRSERHKRQDIEVGKAVRPQLALRVADAASAWKKLHGKNVVVECKFDGDRIQIHKNGSEIHYFSRNFLDHLEYAPGMSSIILQNIQVDRCILDGEMLVWDTATNRFAEFGSNQEIAKVAREGLESDRQLCYVAFDILYVGDTSVIHQSLTERHDLLRKFVKPVKGRLEILIPDGNLNDLRSPGEPCWSIVAYSVEDVERFFRETIENRDEGIILKDLGSKWEPGDRSVKWMKLKPDYIHAGADLDVLIIGGYFGSGRRGGECSSWSSVSYPTLQECSKDVSRWLMRAQWFVDWKVAQFLAGLAEHSDSSGYPKRFISFCRVGTGLSDEELDALTNKLKPYFRKNEYPKRPPRFYEVTNHSKERPDVWIDSPDKSIILSITSDIRTIKSGVFAAPYSLRFPRIQRVRYDKPWHECLDLQSFMDLVHSSNGNTQRPDHGAPQNQISKHLKATKPVKAEKKNISVIPSHFKQTDVSAIKGETFIFANMMFYFINVPPSYTIDHFRKMVAENGGNFSMNLNDSVTHCIAAEKKGIKYQAAMRQGDVIHVSWVLDCCAQKRLVHLQPKYFLFLADSSKSKFQGEIDAFLDYYYWDLDITDMKQIFSNMSGLENLKSISYYKRKYFPMESMCVFQDCHIFFYEMLIVNKDLRMVSELALRRMRLDITMRGGEVCDSLAHATHLVACSTLGSHNFDELYKSLPNAERRRLHNKRLHVVMHQWLDDSLAKGKKLPEDAYNLKPDTLQDLEFEESKEDIQVPPTTSEIERRKVSEPVDTGEKQKRGRPRGANTKRGRAAPKPHRRTRARIGNRAAKLNSDEVDNINPVDESDGGEADESMEEIQSDLEENDRSEENKEKEGKRVEELEDKERKAEHAEERRKGSEAVAVSEIGKKGAGEQLEQMVDPLQAMLLDMIPTLSQKREGTASSVASVGEGEKKTETGDPDATLSSPAQKKKRVSYKDVAGQLLKDW